MTILGPSGCGKSTLIKLLAGLLPRHSDGVLDGDVELFGSSPLEYRSAGTLSVMFQEPTLLPHLTVEQNISLPLALLKREAPSYVAELLQITGLQAYRNYLPRHLSGGMQTRTALARSFVSNPSLLLLDEPFSGLDLGWKESLYSSLQQLSMQIGATIVMVTHDLEEAVYNSNRILAMNEHGSFTAEFYVPGSLPRGYRVGETIARHTTLLSDLAEVVTTPPVQAVVCS